MITFRDKTFCASPGCTNECGKKMSDEERTQIYKMAELCPDEVLPVCYGYFCGETVSGNTSQT